ncbi:hypothetical protein JXD38_03680 [candidate division WOR-3 bacterium]|nr:hypothetical protein [candidate division WOR-3 bacterium]
MVMMDHLSRSLVTLALAGGLVWAVVVWRRRQRTAALVGAACALMLAVRLIWLPAVRLLFGQSPWTTGAVQRFFILTGNALSHVALAVSLGLLIFAALEPAGRRS